jgi:transcriptional regulator with XRE-family HTH domain
MKSLRSRARLLYLEDVIRLLRTEVERAGGQRAFARKAGVNVSVVSRTLNRQRLPSEKVLRVLKLRAILERVLNVRKILDLEEVMRLLRSEIEAGSQRAFARKAGVNHSVVSRTLSGQSLPSEKILRALKLRVVYLSK